MAEGLVPVRSNSHVHHELAASHATGPEAGPPETPPLERAVAAIRRYKWLVAVVVSVGLAGGLFSVRLIKPAYEARATVWVEQAQQSGDHTGPIRSQELLSSSHAYIELFRSYRIVDEVVRKLALHLQPENSSDRPVFASFELANRFVPGGYELQVDKTRKMWQLKTLEGIQIEHGSATDSVGRRVGFQWTVPWEMLSGSDTRAIRFFVATPRETSIRMLDQLENRLALGSNFLWLSYEDRDPQLAAKTLNTWLQEFVRVAAELKKKNIVEFSNILSAQLLYAEKATQDAETAYQKFRVGTIILPTEGGPVAAGVNGAQGGDPALQSFFEQKIAYDNLRHDRIAIEKLISSASTGNAPYEGLLLIPSVAQSPGAEAVREAFRTLYETQARLRVERQTFTDEYPTVKQLVGAIDVLQHQTIPQLARQMLAQLADRELDYQRRIQGASKELQQIPPRTIEEMRLHRAVTVAEGLYTNLKNRYAEAKLAEASAAPDVSILDTAVAPLKPMKDKSGALIFAAIAGALAAGVGLAMVLDKMDGKFRYTYQATSELGLTVAGAIPRTPKRGISASSPEQVMQFVESFRTIRMHVMHSIPGKRLTLAVTSAAPGDGKSMVATNLALSFAEAGLRTVLVDADTRRGTLHRTFALKAPGGLTECLQDLLPITQAARATPHANLWLVSCGKRHSRSPELLSSPRLSQLVNDLAQSYDVVIFDTPPLAAGIDAYAVSAAAGRVLMVLRLGQTERRLVAGKLSMLDRLPVEVIGAVLNAVPLTGEFQYYAYSSGYGVGGDELGDELRVTSTTSA